jgi:hypothetical protein
MEGKMSKVILNGLFLIIFAIACCAFLEGCSRKSDLSQLTEQVLDEDQKITIEITPGAKVK